MSEIGQLCGERVANNKFPQSPMLANSSVENAQGLQRSKPQTKMEKFPTEPTRSKEPTLSFQQTTALEATCT